MARASRERLIAWLVATKTGDRRLRAGVPAGWRVGDKTGSGDHGTTNDIGIVWPPGGGAVLVAAYLTETSRDTPACEAVLAGVGRMRWHEGAMKLLQRLSEDRQYPLSIAHAVAAAVLACSS